ncbi:hypothetical protein ACR784_07670 [Sphingobacterium multivorum]|jgi:ABC-type phosphate/phosphonate transport system permease subunit|uniref:hypothetical protein n=1 Tax=Sphingobacterium multivorum TaxID=28454 RepID=UPI00155928FF|nr:hypothetical protein [Sphingobacterium multivorum]QRQ61226.1 hypothetical protein I6J33_24520 [Sphingobacterium multivorum]
MKANDMRVAALGGTLCSVWASISFGEIIQTILMAMLGTIVSFATGYLLGCLRRKWCKK